MSKVLYGSCCRTLEGSVIYAYITKMINMSIPDQILYKSYMSLSYISYFLLGRIEDV